MTLVFDTETTGKADFKRPAKDPVQPRLVQLGAILFDSDWHVRAEMNLIVKPDGYTISPEVAAIHGITQEIAERYGMSERPVLSLFAGMCKRAETLVAHNINFDGLVIGRAFHVHGLDHIPPHNIFCTMNAMTPICKLPGMRGDYKWPQLKEAYKHCFGREFEGAHDAMADVRACAEVYRWLFLNNHIK